MTPVNKEEVKLNITIRDRRKVLFFGKGFSLSSTNEKGDFDILPQHANIISLIRDYVVVDKSLKSEKKFTTRQGILVVKENNVQAFLD